MDEDGPGVVVAVAMAPGWVAGVLAQEVVAAVAKVAEATAAAMAALQAERAAVEAAAEAGCTEPRRPQRAGYGRRQSHCPCSRQ